MTFKKLCDVCEREIGKRLEDDIKLRRVGIGLMQKFDGWSSSYEQSYDICIDCWKRIGKEAKKGNSPKPSSTKGNKI